MSKLMLPKKYEIKESTPEKFHKYEGLPKLSYSQYSSWKDPMYREQYIKQYFFGIDEESPFQVFATFGSHVGEYIETNGEQVGDMLSPNDIEILDAMERPKRATYEEEIVVPILDKNGEILFVTQGFIDECEYLDDTIVKVKDFKTGNAEKKAAFYASEEYGQTTLYSYAKELDGCTIDDSLVTLLGRKGNGRANSPIRLSGEIVDIPTPYGKTRVNRLLKDLTKVAKEISEYYKVLLKVRK